MPVLTQPYPAFQPFTKILSAETNANNAAIRTLLNVTKLDYENLQLNNLFYASQLSMQVAVTDTLGALTLITTLPIVNGGLGFSPVITTINVGQVVQVNTDGTALTLDAAPEPSTGKIYSFYRFG